jgi:hypothetical protein
MSLKIEIKERRLSCKRVGPKGRYVQYELTIPKSFVEKHGRPDRVYWIADDLLVIAPNKDLIMKLIKIIPELEALGEEVAG